MTTVQGRARKAATATAVALAGLLATSACGTQVGSGGSEPPALRIGAGSSSTAADAAARSAAGGGITLDGTLPSTPSSAAVQRYGTDRIPQERVRALATALGISGDPQRRAHGWEVGSGSAVLRVRDGDGQWSYSRAGLECPSYLVDVESGSGDAAVSCAVAEPPAGDPAPAVPVPTDAIALAAAAPVLAVAGLDDQARVLPFSAGLVRTVAADPVVAGLPTSGVRTLVDVDRTGIAAGYGRLGTTTQGPSYPLVSARTAFDAISVLPRAVPEIACVQSEDEPTVCPQAKPVVVTGARLGLALAHEDGAALLVPAWLFAVRGSNEPLTAIAAEPRYLADPEPVDEPSGSSVPGSSGGSGSMPKPPSSDTPVPPATEPGPVVAAITTASVSTDGRTLTLVGWGGSCATYDGIADESRTAVKAQLVGTSTIGPDQACDAMAVEVRVRVALDEPLGSRTLHDATTGETVAVARS